MGTVFLFKKVKGCLFFVNGSITIYRVFSYFVMEHIFEVNELKYFAYFCKTF